MRPRAFLGRRAVSAARTVENLTQYSSRKPKDGDSEDSRVEVSKDDISALTWATIGKSQQFRVHRFDGVEER